MKRNLLHWSFAVFCCLFYSLQSNAYTTDQKFWYGGVCYYVGAYSTNAHVIQPVANISGALIGDKNPQYSGDVVIPETFKHDGITFKVTEIEGKAFYNATNLKSVSIPNSIELIGNYAFQGCSNLKKIILPSSVYDIGWDAFRDCTSLDSATVWCYYEGLPINAFRDCKNLKYVNLHCSGSIGDNAFTGCSSLNTVVLNNVNDGITSIENYAFWECSSLKRITIPSTVASIGTMAFYGCSGLSLISCLAMTPPTYGTGSFDTSILTSAILSVPGSTVSAYQQASGWKGFTKIKEITQEIASGTTGDCLWILDEDYTLTIFGTGAMADYSVDSPAPWYSYNSKIKSANVCDGVTNIGNSAFFGCGNLISVTIGNTVTSIGYEAFDCCTGLLSVIIPNSVKSIGEGAFMYCI